MVLVKVSQSKWSFDGAPKLGALQSWYLAVTLPMCAGPRHQCATSNPFTLVLIEPDAYRSTDPSGAPYPWRLDGSRCIVSADSANPKHSSTTPTLRGGSRVVASGGVVRISSVLISSGGTYDSLYFQIACAMCPQKTVARSQAALAVCTALRHLQAGCRCHCQDSSASGQG